MWLNQNEQVKEWEWIKPERKAGQSTWGVLGLWICVRVRVPSADCLKQKREVI